MQLAAPETETLPQGDGLFEEDDEAEAVVLASPEDDGLALLDTEAALGLELLDKSALVVVDTHADAKPVGDAALVADEDVLSLTESLARGVAVACE